MKSFPSSFNRGGNSQRFTGKHEAMAQLDPNGEVKGLEKIRAKNLNYSTAVKQVLFNQVDTSHFDRYINFTKEVNRGQDENVIFENPQFIPSWVLRSMNNYRGVFNNKLKSKMDASRSGNIMTISIAKTDVSPALFNPQFMVQAVGMTQNVPLLTNFRPTSPHHEKNIGDCRIEKLISDSLYPQSPLGMARYRLVDFMYCKDLGKVSNNHLITLRKFPFPIGDHIFQFSGPQYAGQLGSCETPGDVGRLLAWFGTEDNKLEDICKFETQATWKEITNKIQEIDSRENNQERGPLGMILNSVNPAYNRYADVTGNGAHNVLAELGSGWYPGLRKESTDNNETLRMAADHNKVYTPKNTVQDNHIYEGRLILKQEMTVTFSYKLRAYENINPKSAFLDLMGNILEVTYQRGRYWKGETRLIGSPQNRTGWQKANALVDNAWSKLGGFMESIASGTMNFGDILGAVSNMIGNIGSDVINGLKNIDPSTLGQDLVNKLKTINEKTGLSHGMKALLKNQLGRPALYAMDSLISGDDMGCWHLTIGNPYNPIMTIGNLILTSSTVTHSGALGVDDFPSEVKVVCTLKPARSRDSTGIARYYTKGMNGLYLPTSRNNSSDFYNFIGSNGKVFSSMKLDEKRAKSEKANIGQADTTDATNKNTNSSKPNEGANNKELTPIEDAFSSELAAYHKKDTKNGNSFDSSSNINSGTWEGIKTEEATKIFSLNNYSMVHWNIGNDEIS